MITETIKFHEDDLIAYKEDDRIFVAIRPIALAIGLNADSALRGIKNDEILGVECTQQYGRNARNQRVLVHVLPIEHVHGWLFSIQISQVKEDVRPKLLLYKKECYRALYDHFMGASRKVTSNVTHIFQKKTYLEKLERLASLVAKRKKEVERQISALELNSYHQLNLFDNSLSDKSPEELLK